MKILLAGTLVGRGGIQSHLRWLAKGLGRNGLQTLVLSLGQHSPSEEDFSVAQSLENETTSVKFVSTNANGNFNARKKLQRLREIKKIVDEFSPDIYVATGTGWNLFLAPSLSTAKPKRIFFEVMSGIPSGWRDSRWFVKWTFDEVVGQAKPVSENFIRHFDWTGPITSIPAIPEPLELTARLPQVTKKTIELGKARAALFSRLVPHKQAFWLVQQWNILKEFLSELHVHGSGPEEQPIRNYIETHGIGDRVKCFGRYPEGQAYVDLLSSYDLTLLPTIGQEGAPLVLLESMACGVPFVAYGMGGISDYAEGNPNCLVIHPAADFIQAVKTFMMRLSREQINQEAVQNFYLENYSYATLSERWLKQIRSL
jgi:glycosyltransferase involved in cell wall biosynthesis